MFGAGFDPLLHIERQIRPVVSRHLPDPLVLAAFESGVGSHDRVLNELVGKHPRCRAELEVLRRHAGYWGERRLDADRESFAA